MAALTPTFRADSRRIHEEHEIILQELDELDAALDHLAGFTDAAADPGTRERVRLYSQRLMAQLPEHCVREEYGLLETVSSISPELREFARQMKIQHNEIMSKLYGFCQAVTDLDEALDPDTALETLMAQGRDFTRSMRAHMTLEEHQLSGFL